VSAFKYQGPIPASKSLMNRALLIQSYFPDLTIQGDSNCDDVLLMKSAVKSLHEKSEIHCGEAGTVLRFMALRAAREPGTWKLTGSKRLFQRPQEDIVLILEQLGVSCRLHPEMMLIKGEGWKRPQVPVLVQRRKSSQFVSSLLLNSWRLSFPLEFETKGQNLSEGYWQMSKGIVEDLGMQLKESGGIQTVPQNQSISESKIEVEMDCSSGFAIAAAAVLDGSVEITNYNSESLQPDRAFFQILKKMGAEISLKGSTLKVEKSDRLRSIEIDLKDSPDLFPVLAVLCAFAKGSSRLYGAPQLVLKESNRILKTAELLKLAGIPAEIHTDGLTIQGGEPIASHKGFSFNPDLDHRMAMAAALFKLKSYPVTIQTPEVVSKSFPEFWQILGIKP
jgi:3-phosphoshikimate 1-carboxyvinyltransferase